MKRYLFFLRHYNDIDNIAPAIYFFLERNPAARADVVIYSQDYDFRADHNLKLLGDTFPGRFRVRWLGEYLGLDTARHFNGLKAGEKPVPKRPGAVRRALKLIAPLVPVRARRALRNFRADTGRKMKDVPSVDRLARGRAGREMASAAIREVLAEPGMPCVVCFDVNRTASVRGILEALRVNGVGKIVCLPVSPLINFNVLRNYKMFDVGSREFLELHDYSGFDRVGYVDGHFAGSFENLFDSLGLASTLAGKTEFLGSIRFCPAWMGIREKALPRVDIETKAIRTVFFLSHPIANVNGEEVQATLSLLGAFPGYRVLVKPHTRDGTGENCALPGNVSYTRANSSALVNWAEVVLFWGTSVALEGYIKGKTMVCLEYICGNRNLYAFRNAGFIAHCRDDLCEFLARYPNDRSVAGYNPQGIKTLLETDIIPGGDRVIDNHLDFLSRAEF